MTQRLLFITPLLLGLTLAGLGRTAEGKTSRKESRPAQKSGQLVMKVYPVADLIEAASSRKVGNRQAKDQPIEELLKSLITNTIVPDSWDGKGGLGTIHYFPLSMSLVVEQFPANHEHIDHLLSALRRHGSLATSTGATEERKNNKIKQPTAAQPQLIQRVYPVADLVVPIPSGREGNNKEQGRTLEDKLIQLITKKVAPASWSCNGGEGTVQYYPLGMSLVVKHTPAIHEKVAALLRHLKRSNELEVMMEMRILHLPEATAQQLLARVPQEETSKQLRELAQAWQPTPLPFSLKEIDYPACPLKKEGVVFLSSDQVQEWLKANQAHSLNFPRITLCNGQQAMVERGSELPLLRSIKADQKEEEVIIQASTKKHFFGTKVLLKPIVAADNRSVKVTFQITETRMDFPISKAVEIPVTPKNARGLVPTASVVESVCLPEIVTHRELGEVLIPDGQTAVLDGGKIIYEGCSEFSHPILGQIPEWLGNLCSLFGYGQETQQKLILLTPRILVPEEEEVVFIQEVKAFPKARGTPPRP